MGTYQNNRYYADRNIGNGNEWTRRMDSYLWAQTGAGGLNPFGIASGFMYSPLPRGLRPRHVIGRAASGATARAVVYHITAGLWTGADTTWTGVSKSGAVETYTVTGWVSECQSVSRRTW